MKIAVIGGGINGLMSASYFSDLGYDVHLYEKNFVCSETSSKSSKLIHGGIRYLENFQFSLVKEALMCQKLWLEQYPEFLNIKRFYIPIYSSSPKNIFYVYLGAKIYEFLSGRKTLGKSKMHTKKETKKLLPHISNDHLKGCVSYMDVIMDDHALIAKLAEDVSKKITVYEQTRVTNASEDGSIEINGMRLVYDRVINVCGPWVNEIGGSNIEMDLIRGSHLRTKKISDNPILNINSDGRVLFIIPYNNESYIGTTEVRHEQDKPAYCTNEEMTYLLKNANNVLNKKLNVSDIIGTYSGVRPIVKDKKDYSKSSRDSLITQNGKLVEVYGGKWTSSIILGEKVGEYI